MPKSQKSFRNERLKQYSKRYRSQQKQKYKEMQEQNQFLKKKIQNLSFRLKQTELQLNRLKHQNISERANFNTLKQNCLKNIEETFKKKEFDPRKLQELYNQFQQVTAFSGKMRTDVINYHMSQFLQTIMTDMSLYFFKSVLNKRGVCAQDQTHFKKLDFQLMEQLGLQQAKKRIQFTKSIPQIVISQYRKLQSLWKTFYTSYVKILDVGYFLEKLIFQCSNNNKIDFLLKQTQRVKFEIYFQKIKYRKDVRELRDKWLQQLANTTCVSQQEKNYNKNPSKKVQL